MYNNLSESTDAIVPNEIVEMPPIQNNNDTPSANKYTDYFKKTIRRLGVRNKNSHKRKSFKVTNFLFFLTIFFYAVYNNSSFCCLIFHEHC